jgi:hypothetical protein
MIFNKNHIAMNSLKLILPIAWIGLALGQQLNAAPENQPANPDFTKGEAIPEKATKSTSPKWPTTRYLCSMLRVPRSI